MYISTFIHIQILSPSLLWVYIVMGFKFWCQVGEFRFYFQNSYREMCFWKTMLKVRCFKTTSDHRPFWSKFDVKLGSWVIIHTGEHSPLEVLTKLLHLPPGSSHWFFFWVYENFEIYPFFQNNGYTANGYISSILKKWV